MKQKTIKKFALLVCGLLLFVIGCKWGKSPTQDELQPRKLYVDIYDSTKAYNGTTLLPDKHDLNRPRVIEVNMQGEVVWEYVLPDSLKEYINPGFDAELLSNNNILVLLPRYGIIEIDRNGNILWTYLDKKISHDADRLPNGNTIYVFGASDRKSDAQVKEVNPQGQIIWKWYAREHFDVAPYDTIFWSGWTHTNAVIRKDNGNTLISLRNFHFIAEVDPQGNVINTIGEGICYAPHDPSLLSNGNILISSCKPEPGWGADPSAYVPVIEVNPQTGAIVWQYDDTDWYNNQGTRDADRLPNGNTLITGSNQIIEVTPSGEIVWRLNLEMSFATGAEAAEKGFYKAERISASAQ